MKIAGIILIVAGVLMLVFKGFNFTNEKKVVDLGPVEINKKEKHSINWPAYAGGVAIAAGALIFLAARKKDA